MSYAWSHGTLDHVDVIADLKRPAKKWLVALHPHFQKKNTVCMCLYIYIDRLCVCVFQVRTLWQTEQYSTSKYSDFPYLWVTYVSLPEGM